VIDLNKLWKFIRKNSFDLIVIALSIVSDVLYFQLKYNIALAFGILATIFLLSSFLLKLYVNRRNLNEQTN
jgi:hypothetical protein